MKAIVYTKYGTPDALRLTEIEKPIPKDNEVLVKIRTASINSWDWDRLTGKPKIYQLIHGLFKPSIQILGSDIAGQVEAVGKNITLFKAGDEVFGDLSEYKWGGFAEYVCAPENALTLKPAGMTFEQAAALPQGGAMALQGIRNKKQIKSGDKVLINGAGGTTGTLAVQIAKSLGAEVTAVDKKVKFDMLFSLGADHVIDYQQEDFTKNGKQYDLIFDLMAYHSMFDYKRALSPGGVYIIVGGAIRRILQALFIGSWISWTSDKKISILAHKANKNMSDLIVLFEEGKVKPVIDKIFPLEQTADAFRYFGEGQYKGKIVITV